MIKKTKKPRVAIISLTSCEGCQFVLLDQGKKFLRLLDKIQLDEFRLLEDDDIPPGEYDLCIVEGNPLTAANEKLLIDMRRRSKFLVALGNCAAMGGVWELKNYANKEKIAKSVYKDSRQIENPPVREIGNLVKVDYVIPGCPIDGADAMEALYQIINGRLPRLPQSPVCNECQNNGYKCLLQQGQACLGPISLGGCQAVCLKSKQACWGCRGTFEGAQIQNLLKLFRAEYDPSEARRAMEIFGDKDEIIRLLAEKSGKDRAKKKAVKK